MMKNSTITTRRGLLFYGMTYQVFAIDLFKSRHVIAMKSCKTPIYPSGKDIEKTSRRFSMKFLIGVMNSNCARDFLLANRRSNLNLYPDDWKQLPIPDVSPEQQTPIVELVDKILAAKRKGLERKVTRLEKKLDKKVSVLYGVEDEEGDE